MQLLSLYVLQAQLILLMILLVAIVNFMIGTFIPPSETKQQKGISGYSSTCDTVRQLWEGFVTNFENDLKNLACSLLASYSRMSKMILFVLEISVSVVFLLVIYQRRVMGKFKLRFDLNNISIRLYLKFRMIRFEKRGRV